MADRSITVRLRAEVSDFQREMGKSAKTLDDLVKKSDSSSKASTTFLGRVAQSSQVQREMWTTVGAGATATGAAMLALTGAVAKTGGQYNTLQQTSRAALKTILGGAAQANAQMDKLDAFAKTSPFSKAVFVSAQQQMLGFGIEAQKVIPYLSAINDAVAAVGGSNDDISELTRIFSQVQAAQKITAVDLMQFGQRGVDAATLIGSQMGKTGSEIREQITKGTLDAGVALDALAAGMSERFAGASTNVKNTMTGALDRVSAAWRDLSATIMDPAISQAGGGWLVGLTNNLADLLRQVGKLPAPLLQVGAALTGLGGAALVAGGGFLLFLPRALETHRAFKQMQTTFPRVSSGLAKVGKAAAVAGVAIAGLAVLGGVQESMRDREAEIDNLVAALERLKRGMGSVDEMFEGAIQPLINIPLADNINNAAVAFATLKAADGDFLMRGFNGIINAFTGLQSPAHQVQTRLAQIDSQLREISPDVAVRTFQEIQKSATEAGYGVDELVELFPSYAARIQEVAAKNGHAKLSNEELATAMAGVGPIAEMVAKAFGTQADAAEGVTEATAELSKEQLKWLEMVEGADASFVNLLSAHDQVIEKNTELAEKTAETTKSTKDSWEDYYDGVSVAFSDYLAELERQVAAQAQWEQNMLTLSQRVSQGVIDELAKLGPEGAPLVANLVNASDAELARFEKSFKQRGAEATSGFANTLRESQPVLAALGATMGKTVVDKVAGQLARGEVTLQDVIKRYNLEAAIRLNTTPAEQQFYTLTRNLSGKTVWVNVGSRPTSNYGKYATMRAAGGPITGPGTGTSDSIMMLASNGEYVIRAAAAERLGRARLDWLNQTGTLPAYADGGAVGTIPDFAQQMMAGVLPLVDLRRLIDALARQTEATQQAARVAVQRAAAEKAAEAAVTRAQSALKAAKASPTKSADKRLDAEITRAQEALKAARSAPSTKRTKAAKDRKVAAAEKALKAAKAAKSAADEKAKESHAKRVSAAEKALEQAKRAEESASDRAREATDDLTEAQRRQVEQARDVERAQRAIADAARQASDNLRDSWMQGGDTTDLLANMRDGQSALTSFADQIEQLRARGLREDLVQQIIKQGAALGGETAADILGRDPKDLAALNDAADKLKMASDRMGYVGVIGNPRYDVPIPGQLTPLPTLPGSPVLPGPRAGATVSIGRIEVVAKGVTAAEVASDITTGLRDALRAAGVG